MTPVSTLAETVLQQRAGVKLQSLAAVAVNAITMFRCIVQHFPGAAFTVLNETPSRIASVYLCNLSKLALLEKPFSRFDKSLT